jgi:stage II sporulation protein M
MSKKRVKKGEKIATFFKDNYSKSWAYIKESKNFIWAVIILFSLSIVLGVLFQPPVIINLILDYIQEVLIKTEGMSTSSMIGFILTNNLQSGFMGIIYGVFFGIFPIMVTIANGYIVGYVSSSAVSSSGVSSLLNLLPHGIFELPAIFISFGMGLKFGTFVFHKEIIKHFNKFFLNSLRVFVFVVLPLLVIAAIIEGVLMFI